MRGATGDNAPSVNGIYEATEEMSGGMPVYRKQDDPDKWLMYNPKKKHWYVQSTSDKGTSGGWAYLKCDPPCLPKNGTKRTWKLWDGSDYHTQTDVDISIATPQELADAAALIADAAALIAAAAEALAASVTADGRKVNEQKYKYNSFLYLV